MRKALLILIPIIAVLVVLFWEHVPKGEENGISKARFDNALIDDNNPLSMPPIGAHGLRVLTPRILELTLITTKEPDQELTKWNFVRGHSRVDLPASHEFLVRVNGRIQFIKSVDFKRRVLYAPLEKRDLRILNNLYLHLKDAVPEGAEVTVETTNYQLWQPEVKFKTIAEKMRWSPVIHVNQVGYIPKLTKKAFLGYYLGSGGEFVELERIGFKLIDVSSGAEVYSGRMHRRFDVGFPFAVPQYQRVLEADFTDFNIAGEYRLYVPGYGASYPFFINEGVAATFARTYALGLYHQRCGGKNDMPFTRFVHDVCHEAQAEIPTADFKKVWEHLASMSKNRSEHQEQTAPQLTDAITSLYPFVKTGKVDVSGGHHDAGDYSKYLINSALLIHYLVFAVDAFPGVADLDNLGLPESGDGISDVLQLGVWEADFLAKMQDDDGGFFFLVYPRDRKYESHVLPDHGDPQVVFPKNTAVTASAVAALLQTATSPVFKEAFPDKAALYKEKALKGWSFLETAWQKFGSDFGAYQKVSHYGDAFLDHDEIVWAATEMYLATGNPDIHSFLLKEFDPTDRSTHRWKWWRMYKSYGCAIRSYAFASLTGRVSFSNLDSTHLERCRREIIGTGQDQVEWADNSAYRVSLPMASKRTGTAGWFFANNAGFDAAVAYQLDRNDKFLNVIVSNMNYEAGSNPVNVSMLTGVGWRRQREVVHQYAQNDRRILPPTGIPIACLQTGFQNLKTYGNELKSLSFPADEDEDNPYAFYDRWGDSFNTTTEFVAATQARGLAVLSCLMARTQYKNSKWQTAHVQVLLDPPNPSVGKSLTASLEVLGLDLSNARIVWEAKDAEPVYGPTFTYSPARKGAQWIEAEALLAHGRRVFAVKEFHVK